MDTNQNDRLPMYRTFISSCKIFGGYELYIDITKTKSLDDIINIFYETLLNLFKKHNLTKLVDILTKSIFHIEGYTYEDVMNSGRNDIFYICNQT